MEGDSTNVFPHYKKWPLCLYNEASLHTKHTLREYQHLHTVRFQFFLDYLYKSLKINFQNSNLKCHFFFKSNTKYNFKLPQLLMEPTK